MGLRFAEGAALSIPDTLARNSYFANRDAIEVAMIGAQLLGVHLATLALMLPLVVLIYVELNRFAVVGLSFRCPAERLLLGGGTKKRQSRDISAAADAWIDYKRRKPAR